MQRQRRFLRIAIGLALSSFLLTGVMSTPSPARQNDRELFESGQSCQQQLLASHKKQKLRIYWERCIHPFERLLSRYPQSSLTDRSLFILGGLYRGLYGYSGSLPDQEKSVSYYKKLVDEHPDSSLIKKTKTRLRAVNPSPTTTIQNIRHWAYPDYTRLVLDLDRPVRLKTIEKGNPSAVILDLENTRLGDRAKSQLKSLDAGLLQWVDLKATSQENVQIFISLKGSVDQTKVVSLDSPDRLVIDLFEELSAALKEKPLTKPTSPKTVASLPAMTIDTIVIDPGHGGKDPGAIGRRGLTEKEVVLDIGLRLRNLIQKNLKKTAIMTRNRDKFISLNDRTSLANSKKADLFISIHVNSHPRRSTRGVEIYLLGQSSDKRALTVAARENSVSLESMSHLDKTVQQILFDLGQDFKVNQSLEIADLTRRSFLRTFSKEYGYKVVDLRIKQAPFYVLLNSDMPGILVEVSYISNKTEEKLLRKKRYRQALAETLFEAARQYISSLESIS